MSNDTIVYADVAITAVAEGRDLELVLRHRLGQLGGGVGHVDRKQVRQAGRDLDWSSRTLQRVLRAGNGVFWRRTRGRCYLQSIAKIAIGLGVHSVRAAFPVSIADLRKSRGSVKARLALRAIAAIRDGAPIANATMADLLHVSSRSVRAWKKRSGVAVVNNFALIAPIQSGSSVMAFRRIGGPPSLRTVAFEGRRWLCRSEKYLQGGTAYARRQAAQH